MPLKTIVSPIDNPEKFSQAVDEAMQMIHQDFLAFNRMHTGKAAEVSRSVTFHVTETSLVCIMYYSWNLADQSSLVIPTPQPSRPRLVQ